MSATAEGGRHRCGNGLHSDSAAQEGHGEPTSEKRHIWGLFELDPLLSPYLDTTHVTREVSEDSMLEEVAASFVVTSHRSQSPVLPLRSKRLAAQSLSRVRASKRGEVLIMQRIGYTKGP
jgi:hypothetical protein